MNILVFRVRVWYRIEMKLKVVATMWDVRKWCSDEFECKSNFEGWVNTQKIEESYRWYDGEIAVGFKLTNGLNRLLFVY